MIKTLPDFPWDLLAPYKLQAQQHPDGIVDLSIGTPVDPTPEIVRRALADAADAPGYPATYGTPALRDAAAGWLSRRLGAAADPAAVLPVIGTKELVAWLPTLLGVGPGDTVAIPGLAYPTYDVGARLAGATAVPVDGLLTLGPSGAAGRSHGGGTQTPEIVWINSPSNPTGQVLPTEHLRKVVSWARERGVILISDECYAELGWEAEPVSVLHPDVCGQDHTGLLAVHSLSKRSNLAGYRAGFVAGDPGLVKDLLEIRKHAGMIVPAPVQAAMTAALSDDEHVEEQRARYARRRDALRAAFEAYGFRVDHSQGGLYLWLTRDEPCWNTVKTLAELGILVAPGEFYGARGRQHIRVAFTATDERVAAAVARLTA
jgi:succinyldiaminopimelate transaminase